jgi:hemolysin activation/secretion protein
LALGLYLAVLVSAPAADQNYQQIAPKPVPQTGPAPTVPESPAAPAQGGDAGQMLIRKLKALVFLPTPSDVDTTGTHARGVVYRNVTVPSEPDFTTLVTPYLSQSLTRGQLNTLIAAIIVFYREHDRPLVDVIVPEQPISAGVLQLVLLDGKLGKVVVKGNRWFSSSEISSDIRAQPGGSISANQLQGDLDWINQNPFLNTELVYSPGEKLGQTDLVLQTHDRFPVRFFAGYEDSGNAQTGFDRYLGGFNYGDLFGLGQQLNYQYTTSGDGDSLRAHAGSYIIPLPWRHTLTFFGSYVDTKGTVPPLVDLIGRNYQISGRYSIPLPTLTFGQEVKYKHSFAAGFDYKYNNNSLEFGGLTTGSVPYDVDQFVMAYNGAETDPYGQTTINDQLYVSPGNWGGNNNDATFAASHAGATSDYVYNTLILERLTKLPGDWTLDLRGTLQTSNANLVPSEQLGFGGYDTVRGYDEREVNTDEGYIFTTELRTPPLSLGETFGCPEFNDQLQLLGFWDYGAAYDHAPLPGEASEIPLSALGFGVRYSINTNVSVRFDYGFQLLRTGLDNDHGSRSDLGIVVSY